MYNIQYLLLTYHHFYKVESSSKFRVRNFRGTFLAQDQSNFQNLGPGQKFWSRIKQTFKISDQFGTIDTRPGWSVDPWLRVDLSINHDVSLILK